MYKLFTIAEKNEFIQKEGKPAEIVAWASKPVIDRSDEVIDAKAWDLSDYEKNRVLMLAHDYSKLPVGEVSWIKATDEGLKFKARFAGTETGKEVAQLYREGIMKAFSVGFMPVEQTTESVKMADGSTKNIIRHTKCKLLEISCVSIPCCPDALVDNSIKSKDLVEAVQFCKSHKYDDKGDVIELSVHDVNTDKQDDKLPDNAVEKILDILGFPSISDISSKISMALNRNDGAELSGEFMGIVPAQLLRADVSYCYIDDIFPLDYPVGGTVVIEYHIKNGSNKYFEFTYLIDGDSALLTDPKEVQEQYVAKGLELKGCHGKPKPKDIDDDDIEQKVGRVLSKKNRSLINSTVLQMEEAVSALNDLLEMTSTIQEDGIELEDITQKTINEIEIDEPELEITDPDIKSKEPKTEEVIDVVEVEKKTNQPEQPQQEEIIKNVVAAVARLLSGNVINTVVDKFVAEQVDIAIARMKGKVIYRR